MLKAGCECIVECGNRLIPVFARSFPNVEFIRRSDHNRFLKEQKTPIDFQTPSLNMLLGYIGRTIEDIPALNSYIEPDKEFRTQLREKYERLADGRRIVGISWRSTSEKLETRKSADLKFWHPVINNPNIFVVNLQYGENQEEIQQFQRTYQTTIYDDPDVDPLDSIEQAIAQISAMVLVISISNSTVHMSGALGIPTWLMLPRSSGVLWFWFLNAQTVPGIHRSGYSANLLFQASIVIGGRK